MEFVGRTVRKEFKGFGVYTGVVNSYDSSTGFFQIVYEDGDSEEMDLSEVSQLLKAMETMVNDDQSGNGELKKKPNKRVGRKPKKRPRVAADGSSGKDSSNLTTDRCLKESSEEISKGFLKTSVDDGSKETLSVNCDLSISENPKGLRSDNGINLNHGLDLNEGLNLEDGFNVNDGLAVNSEEFANNCRRIDLNLEVNGFEDSDTEGGFTNSVVKSPKRKHCFDLNLRVEELVKNSDMEPEGHLKENSLFGVVEESQKLDASRVIMEGKKEADCLNEGGCSEISGKTRMEDGYTHAGNAVEDSRNGLSEEVIIGEASKAELNEVRTPTPIDKKVSTFSEVQHSDSGTPLVHGNQEDSVNGKKSRKRKKLSDNGSPATDTVLRRSRRRLESALSKQDSVSSGPILLAENERCSSPAVRVVAKEKPTKKERRSPATVRAVAKEKPSTSGRKKEEEYSVLPSKIELPPSSNNIHLEGISVLDLFSVYACLRSFSALLFLSPFELEEFVEALKCKVPNFLLDSIHVSLLQTLRKHLEFLSDEGLLSATNCLRSLNWDLLDLITWPVFVAEYLLTHGSGLKPGFDLCKLKLLDTDYCQQPAAAKLEILRCLCDDVIEVEAIRSEINRRTMANDLTVDTDRVVKADMSKRRKFMDASSSSCLTEEVDEITDGNSDECCLCKMDGNLICCDGCPAAYHSRCVGVANSLLPEGDWYCPECAIDKDKPWPTLGKSVRGAELLGVDPYGRLYYSSSGYLLVSDSCNNEALYYYYHSNDLPHVIESFMSHPLYNPIIGAIVRQWNSSFNLIGERNVSASNSRVCFEAAKGNMPVIPPLNLEPSVASLGSDNGNERKLGKSSLASQRTVEKENEASVLLNGDPVTENNCTEMENPLTSSKGSAETSQLAAGVQNVPKPGTDCVTISTLMGSESGVQGTDLPIEDSSLSSKIVEGQQEKNKMERCGNVSSNSTVEARENESSHRQLGRIYANSYSLARTAFLVVDELTRKPSEKMTVAPIKTVEDFIAAQLKAISKCHTNFLWPNIQNLNADARKEKCGWCYSCRATDEDRDCFFNMNAPVQSDFMVEMAGLPSEGAKRSHLVDVTSYVLCMEERLRGFLLGPWINPQLTSIWRKNVEEASDIVLLKRFLLLLESNMRELALSAEWMKHVDSVPTLGSASHVVIGSQRIPSKDGIGKKRGRGSDIVPNRSSNSASGLGLFWWRGGRLSRGVFNWKVLPRALASQAARRGGAMKIPGVLYPENSEFAKRSKSLAWRAAVETSRSIGQLALQVRDIDAYIRWDDIENTTIQSKIDQFRRSVRPFRKVTVRRKCMEGTVVKYLLDFGKRRIIPDIVKTHGSIVEESSSDKKKFWLEESHVPLHLLKAFEEKRISRKSNKTSPGKVQSGRVSKSATRNKGFAYLFAKAERSEHYQCQHCNKDVLIREAVSCQYCEGFFHKRHAKKCADSIVADIKYTCHKCLDGKYGKTESAKGSLKSKKRKRHTISRPNESTITQKVCNAKKSAKRRKNKKVTVVVPLRRSARTAVKCVQVGKKKKKKVGRPAKNKNKGKGKEEVNLSVDLNVKVNGKGKGKGKGIGRGKWKRKGKKKEEGKEIQSENAIMKMPKFVTSTKRRTQALHSYWRNGLQLSRKADDERVMLFRSTKLSVASEQLTHMLGQHKCSLCCEQESTSSLNYVACEICGDWFHGDAFGLDMEKIGQLIGFRCHKCRGRVPPVCSHLNRTTSDGAPPDEMDCEAGTVSAEDVSNNVDVLSTVMEEHNNLQKDEKTKCPSNEWGKDAQEPGCVTILDQLSSKNGSIPEGIEQNGDEDQSFDVSVELATVHAFPAEDALAVETLDLVEPIAHASTAEVIAIVDTEQSGGVCTIIETELTTSPANVTENISPVEVMAIVGTEGNGDVGETVKAELTTSTDNVSSSEDVVMAGTEETGGVETVLTSTSNVIVHVSPAKDMMVNAGTGESGCLSTIADTSASNVNGGVDTDVS